MVALMRVGIRIVIQIRMGMLELKAVGDRDSCIGEKKIKANRAQNSLNCFKDELEPVWCIEEIAFKCNKSME